MRETFKGFGLGKIEVRYQIDQSNKRIHVLDLNLPDTTSVTQATESVQNQLFEKLGMDPKEITEWTWILYGRDGRVARYENEDFSFYFLDDPILYSEYKDVMKERTLE